jgi:hypothetical protein
VYAAVVCFYDAVSLFVSFTSSYLYSDARNADEQKLSQSRVRSSGGKGAGDWLLAIPLCPELQIDNKDLCIAMCKRLGVSQKGLDLHLGQPCPCANGAVRHSSTDPHPFACKGLSGDALSVHSNIIRRHDSIKFIIGKMLTTAGSSCVFEKPLVADTGVFLKADISISISAVTTCIDVAIAEAAASTHVNRAASADGAACAAAEKHKVAKYKEVMRLSPTAQFMPFIMEAIHRWIDNFTMVVSRIRTKTQDIYRQCKIQNNKRQKD